MPYTNDTLTSSVCIHCIYGTLVQSEVVVSTANRRSVNYPFFVNFGNYLYSYEVIL